MKLPVERLVVYACRAQDLRECPGYKPLSTVKTSFVAPSHECVHRVGWCCNHPDASDSHVEKPSVAIIGAESDSKDVAVPFQGTWEKCHRSDLKVRCLRKQCGFEGLVSMFPMAVSSYHDLCCPKCGSTNLDTSEINRDWAEHGQKYGFGDVNFLKS